MTTTHTPQSRRSALGAQPTDPPPRDPLDDSGGAARTAGTVLTLPASKGDRLVLSVAEAGELLGLSRAFAYELVARGELPVVRFGRRIVVPKAALLELLGSAVLDS